VIVIFFSFFTPRFEIMTAELRRLRRAGADL
jgi:hypothetical protein